MFLSLIWNNAPVALAWILAILVALTIHEFSHGLAARIRGDMTAERAGRLTLNPLAHIDWMGIIPLLLLGFGWAKPVPFNPQNLKNPKWDSVIVGLAGPASNLIIASIAALVLRFLISGGFFTGLNLLVIFLFLLILINLFLLFFNIIPVHPLDGSKLLFAVFDAPKYEALRRFVSTRGPQILLIAVILAILTELPIFYFISYPAFETCSALIGENCIAIMSMIFMG